MLSARDSLGQDTERVGGKRMKNTSSKYRKEKDSWLLM